MRHAFGIGVVEQDVAAADEGRAVVEQQRGAGGQAGDQPVPHHPAAGGEVEQAVAGFTSLCSWCSLRCCSSVPPAQCTMHLGTPVVPEEYMM
jgi:hypothetical protein